VKDDRDPSRIGQVIIQRPAGVTACQAADWALEGKKPLPPKTMQSVNGSKPRDKS